MRDRPGSGLHALRLPFLLGATGLLLAAADAEACKPFSDPLPTLVVAADALNLRAGPGDSWDVVGSLDHASAIEVREVCGDWARIDGRDSAWVYLPLTCLPKELAHAILEGRLPRSSLVVSRVCRFPTR